MNGNSVQRSIPVITGIGLGQTELSAYDDALWKTGIGNFNVIALSSVIPPGWAPTRQPEPDIPFVWGNRLYVVQAFATTNGRHDTGLAAGIGWAIFDHGGGVFVEHHAVSADAGEALQEVECDIALSIADLCRRRSATPVRQGKATISTTACQPCCVLAVAVFKEENW
jgi:arginine decarboxylase